FQALLYLAAAAARFGENGVGLLFYDLKSGELRRGVVHEEGAATEAKKGLTRGHVLDRDRFDAWRRAGLDRLRELADRLGRGDLAARPTLETCDSCDYGPLCRSRLGSV